MSNPEPKLTFARLSHEMYEAYHRRLAAQGVYLPEPIDKEEASAWYSAAIVGAGLVERNVAMRPYRHGKN